MNFRLPKIMDLAFNPVMIKELRQVTRSRFLIGIIAIYMLVMLSAVGIFIFDLTVSNSADWGSGRQLFNILLPILNFSCILFVPFYTGIRLAIEHSDTNLDLLFTTTLSPGEIIRGKLLNGIVMLVILYSICTPFLVFTYLLRGIDIPTMCIVLVPLFLITIIVIQAAILIATLPTSKPFKIMLGIGGLVASMIGLVASIFLIPEIISSGIAADLNTWRFWGPCLTFLAIGILVFILMHSFSIALIMPSTANRALPVRLACFIAWLATGIGLAIWAKVEHHPEPLAAWAIPTIIGFISVFLFAIGEDDKIRIRVRQSIPRPVILRPLAFIFYSGAGGGIVFCCLAMAIALTVSYAAANAIPPGVHSSRQNVLKLVENLHGFALFALAYGFSAIAIRRFILRNRFPAKFTGVLALLLVTVGGLVPGIIGVTLVYENMKVDSIGMWQLFNPGGILDPKYRATIIAFVSSWAAGMFLVNSPWLFRQARDFMGAKPSAMCVTAVDEMAPTDSLEKILK